MVKSASTLSEYRARPSVTYHPALRAGFSYNKFLGPDTISINFEKTSPYQRNVLSSIPGTSSKDNYHNLKNVLTALNTLGLLIHADTLKFNGPG